MAATFARLCQQVDQTQKELEAEIRQLTVKIDRLETVQSRSKSLRFDWLLFCLLEGVIKVRCWNDAERRAQKKKPKSVNGSCVSSSCRHKATELERLLEEFTNQYLQPGHRRHWRHWRHRCPHLALHYPQCTDRNCSVGPQHWPSAVLMFIRQKFKTTVFKMWKSLSESVSFFHLFFLMCISFKSTF